MTSLSHILIVTRHQFGVTEASCYLLFSSVSYQKMMKDCYSHILMICLLIYVTRSEHVDGSHAMNISKVPGTYQLFSSNIDTELQTCHEWLVENNNTCVCPNSFDGIIKCDDNMLVSILDCYCATFDGIAHEMVAGSCYFNCENNKNVFHDVLYHNISNIIDDVCQNFNREGMLCGSCMKDHYPLVYSFDLKCVNCTNGSDHGNWVRFIAVATIPSTVLFVMILFFRISITSSYLHGFVLFSQGISIPASMRIILRGVRSQRAALQTAKYIASMYGFWNLDFFRPLLPEMCLKLNTLQVMSLDYIVAVYPLLLVALLYIIVILYRKNVRIIVVISHPLRKLYSRFYKRTWNIKSSLMDVYATFFLLSYSKILSVSFDLLIPTRLYHFSNNTRSFAAYYDANFEYFGTEHLPFALSALTVLILFIVIPTLVILIYPFKFFQVVLRKVKLEHSIIKLFVTPFYKCYKDGTDPNTFDCRWFSALFLVLRLLLPIVFSFTLGSVFLPFAVIIIFVFVMILITVKPYKPIYSHYIKSDVTFLLLLALVYLSMISIDVSSIKDHRLVYPSYYLAALFGVIPVLYAILLMTLWIISKRNYGPELVRRLVAVWKFQPYDELEENFVEASIPDRLLNPTDYQSTSVSVNMSRSATKINETY